MLKCFPHTCPHCHIYKKKCSAALHSGSNTPTLGISVMEYVSVMEFVMSGRSPCAVKVLMPEMFRPYGCREPDVKWILRQHSCTVETAQRVSINMSVPKTAYEKNDVLRRLPNTQLPFGLKWVSTCWPISFGLYWVAASAFKMDRFDRMRLKQSYSTIQPKWLVHQHLKHCWHRNLIFDTLFSSPNVLTIQ